MRGRFKRSRLLCMYQACMTRWFATIVACCLILMWTAGAYAELQISVSPRGPRIIMGSGVLWVSFAGVNEIMTTGVSICRPVNQWTWWWFECGYIGDNPKAPWYIALPMWCLIAPILVYMASSAVFCRTRAMSVAKQCVTCGYDITDLLVRCPECGRDL